MVMRQTIDNILCTLYVTENEERLNDIEKAVTVTIVTYNSSKYVVETLESIKAQTYPYIILQVSDDCSQDNTVEVCRQWVEKNADHFIKTKIIVADHNTGVSGNCNRVWDSCETTYLKGIAGDDILLPNCIEDNMRYMEEHPDAIFVFSKIQCFGDDKVQNRKIEGLFDYLKFDVPMNEQLNLLLDGKNFVPASTSFENVKKVREFGIRHDELIPMLEDMPKWVNVLRAGIKLHFFDNTTVKYRISKGSLSTSEIHSPRFRRSQQLYWFYYKFEEDYKTDKNAAITEAVDRYMGLYSSYFSTLNSVYYRVRRSLGKMVHKILRCYPLNCRAGVIVSEKIKYSDNQ